MIKKTVSSLAVLAVLAAFPASALAETIKPVEIRPIPYPLPWRTFETKPGHPVHLAGCGLVQAEGKGLLKYTNVRGRVSVAGKGILGVERSDISKVKIQGFRKATRIGRWVIFVGRGTANGWGTDLDLFFRGKGKTNASGCGKVSFRGKWAGRYIRLMVAKPIPLPVELKAFEPLAK